MNIIRDIDLKIEKKKVFKVIKLTEDSPVYDEVNKTYDILEKKIENIISPKIIYKLDNKIEKEVTEEYYKSDYSLYVITTLGKEISELSTRYFLNNEYLEGMLIDAMGDALLFQLTKKSYENIYDFAKRENIGLTKRLSPGDNISMEFQKDILQKIDPEGHLDISITEGYMLNPQKSITFMYGVNKDEDFKMEKDYDCRICENINCPWREVKNEDDC